VSEAFAVQKYDNTGGEIAYTVTRFAAAGETPLVKGMVGKAEPLRAIAILILRDLGEYPTVEQADELVRLELASLNERPYGVQIVSAARVRRWIEARERALEGRVSEA